MDTASFGMSVASLALQIVGAAVNGYSALRGMTDPHDPMMTGMIDLQVQECRFSSWANAVGLSEQRVSEIGDPFMQRTMLRVLCRMLQLLQEAASLSSRYGLVCKDSGPSENEIPQTLQQSSLSQHNVAGTPMVNDSALALADTRPEIMEALLISAQASFSKFRQFHWVVSDRNLFINLVRQLQETNNNLESLLPRPIQLRAAEIGETSMLYSEDVDHLKSISRVASDSWISLAQSARFKSNYMDTDKNRDAVDRAELIPREHLVLDNPNEESRTLATCEIDGPSPERVLVEWKRIGVLKEATSIEESNRIILDRIKRIVVILSCPTDASFRTLACLGYTTSATGRIGLVFKLPDGAAKAEPSVSLFELLKTPVSPRSVAAGGGVGDSKLRKPALEDRLRLGYALALSLYRLHRTGMIHKHIIPMNIIFFPLKSNSAISIEEPFLAGFGFAREEGMRNHSEIPDDLRDGEKLYRHPSWENGKESTKAVDIYALGILLIEIASWEPIESAAKRAQKQSVTDLRAFLLSEFVESGFLAYRMGTDYQNAVKHCLEVSFENEEGRSISVLGSFYGNVVQGLASFLS